MADKSNGFSERVNFFTSIDQTDQIEKRAGEGFASKSHYLRYVIAKDIKGHDKKEYVITNFTYVAICVMAIYSFIFSAVAVYVIRSGFFC